MRISNTNKFSINPFVFVICLPHLADENKLCIYLLLLLFSSLPLLLLASPLARANGQTNQRTPTRHSARTKIHHPSAANAAQQSSDTQNDRASFSLRIHSADGSHSDAFRLFPNPRCARAPPFANSIFPQLSAPIQHLANQIGCINL